MQMAQVGNQMANAVDQMKYTKAGLLNKNSGFGLAQMSLMAKDSWIPLLSSALRRSRPGQIQRPDASKL